MATTHLIDTDNCLIRLPQEGPLLGWTRWSCDCTSVVATLFATLDDSGSAPVLAWLVSYADTQGRRQFLTPLPDRYTDSGKWSAPYCVLEVNIPFAAFSSGSIKLEVVSLHKIQEEGQPFSLPTDEQRKAMLYDLTRYVGLREMLQNRLKKKRMLLLDPSPESRSFKRRSDRNLDEAIVTQRLPPKKDQPDNFKLIATTCRYPGFAFEARRVDAASFDIIARDHSNASGMLMLGDQIYADATASLFDNLTSLEKFQARYHAMFRSPGFAKAVRAIPCYMTGDDHEFKDSWSVPDDSLSLALHAAAQQSFGVYQLSHSPFKGALDKPPFDYSFTCGPVAVYVMDTLSNRDTTVPGEEQIVSALQLADFKNWLTRSSEFEYVILATGAVVAPGDKVALDAANETDVSRAQGSENWQGSNKQRVELLSIISTSKAKILLVSGDYHCAAMASIKGKDRKEIAKAVVAPPAYAPMRYVSKTIGMLAPLEKTGGYEIELILDGPGKPTEGSGFAIITIEDGDWVVNFKTQEVADT